MLNEYCANEQHIRKSKRIVYVKIAGQKVEVPLCEECFQMVAQGQRFATPVVVGYN